MNIFQAQTKHPEIYSEAKSLCSSLVYLRNSIFIGDIAKKNGIIITLHKRHGNKAIKAIADVMNVTPEYVRRVLKERVETKIRTTNWRTA